VQKLVLTIFTGQRKSGKNFSWKCLVLLCYTKFFICFC